MDPILYDAYLPCFKTPFGAAKTGETIKISIKVSHEVSLLYPKFILRSDSNSSSKSWQMFPVSCSPNFTIFTLSFSVETAGLYFYRFELILSDGTLYIGKGKYGSAIMGENLPEWQLGIYEETDEILPSYRSGIMYQIFPDRFFAKNFLPQKVKQKRYLHENWSDLPQSPKTTQPYLANDFFGGTLRGITEKIPYLASLSVSLLYLNPIFEAAANHRYNTADYFSIDPYLGSMEDFTHLCQTAHTYGMTVILDGVFSHTGSDSIYFNKENHYPSIGAYQSKASPYYSWYHFSSDTTYDCWWGFDTLPNTQELEKSFVNFICGENGVLRYYLKKGADGWRLDVADELPDAFIENVRRAVKAEKKDAYLLGEVWEDASSKESYGTRRQYLWGNELDSVMNYPWRDAILAFVSGGSSWNFYESILSLLDHYPPAAISHLMTPLSTHDTYRALSALSGVPEAEPYCHLSSEKYQAAKHLFKIASVIQYTLPGISCLYYGDEAGVYGFSDPDNRRTYPWGKEDQDLISFFKTLGKLKSEKQSLCDISLEFCEIEDKKISYRRGDNLWVLINMNDHAVSFSLKNAVLAFCVGKTKQENTLITLSAKSAAIFLS